MPLGPGRYRVKTTRTGKEVRLHFTPSGRVNEATNLATGHTATMTNGGVRHSIGRKYHVRGGARGR